MSRSSWTLALLTLLLMVACIVAGSTWWLVGIATVLGVMIGILLGYIAGRM